MISRDRRLDDVGQAVMAAIEESKEPYQVTDLIDRLRLRGHPDDLLRIAILYLIDQDRVELTSQRQLKPTQSPQMTVSH